jgi:hypothetical protein
MFGRDQLRFITLVYEINLKTHETFIKISFFKQKKYFKLVIYNGLIVF